MPCCLIGHVFAVECSTLLCWVQHCCISVPDERRLTHRSAVEWPVMSDASLTPTWVPNTCNPGLSVMWCWMSSGDRKVCLIPHWTARVKTWCFLCQVCYSLHFSVGHTFQVGFLNQVSQTTAASVEHLCWYLWRNWPVACHDGHNDVFVLLERIPIYDIYGRYFM